MTDDITKLTDTELVRLAKIVQEEQQRRKAENVRAAALERLGQTRQVVSSLPFSGPMLEQLDAIAYHLRNGTMPEPEHYWCDDCREHHDV